MHTPIVFIPGFIGHLSFPELTDGMPDGLAFRPDLLGYGVKRDAPVAGITIEDQSAHLRSEIHKFCEDRPVVLFAHSGGAAIAMHYAASHPERVAALVSAEGHLASSDGYLSSKLAVMPLAALSHWVTQIREDPASLLGGQRSRLKSNQLARVISWLDHQPASTILAAARALLFYTARPGYGDEVASVMARLPTYLISGQSTLAGMDVSARFARFARATFTVEGAGHAMVLESPEIVGAQLRDILSLVEKVDNGQTRARVQP
ncbi:MAG: alpha/beta fold hydrolase [Luteibacter sp.]|uniref:alpha/beta fold hydrolase n=1 Tax=Luteibacter sp. TaxID=1886636 RepID=UPI002809F0D4|nr:alpha/beta fold hydrolase [Luteibacter sp.]MDQ7996919.1 alpha/beta fold hydrolase [Luteibacter sp.]MDQ8049291.1 alpha/beta fold hydrolase [Luteibacter sp.]